MDVEIGYSKVQTRKESRVSWNRILVVTVLLVVVVSLCNFCLGIILWKEVKDLQRFALQDGNSSLTSSANSMGIRGLQLNDNFTEWLNEQHRSGRYQLPSNIKDLLHETHRRYRRSTGMCGNGCDCSNRYHPNRRCRRCCWQIHIEEKLTKVSNEVNTLKHQLSSKGSVAQTKYEDRLGHFEGGSDPKNKGCRQNAFLNPQETYLSTTTDGRICMWQYASWMTHGAKVLYRLNTVDGTVKVKHKGVYFIYGQLIVNDIGPRVAQGLWVVDSNGNRKELARCVETARSDGANKTFRTCYFGVMAKIEHGSSVYLAINTEPLDLPVRIFHTDKTAFFGLIKFT